MNGLNMLSYIHCPIPTIASSIPLNIPATTSPPHSSILSLKYVPIPLNASLINVPKNADSPPRAAPTPLKNPCTTPDQSIFTTNVSKSFANCCQSISSNAVYIVLNIPFISSPKVFPAVAQSILLNSPFILSPIAFPNCFQSNVVTKL